jgi:hypothetical protein
MNYAVFEKIDRGIYHIKFSPKLPDNTAFENYLKELTEIINNDIGIYMIFDASYASYISTDLRKKQANWTKKHELQITNSVYCNIYVIPNAIQRSILNDIYLIQKPVVPYKIVPSYKQALNYLLQVKAAKNVA